MHAFSGPQRKAAHRLGLNLHEELKAKTVPEVRAVRCKKDLKSPIIREPNNAHMDFKLKVEGWAVFYRPKICYR